MKTLIALPILMLVFLFTACQNKTENSKNINKNLNVSEFEALIKNDVQLIDVRTKEEFNESHLAKSHNIDINDGSWESEVMKLDKQKPVLVYCQSGGRSSNAASALADLGFTKIYNLEGGIMKWISEGKKIDIIETDNTNKGMSLDDFNELVKSDNYVLVDFHAKWCGPCKEIAPILDKIVKDRTKTLTLEKIDADDNQELLTAKGIDGIPYIELYNKGKLVWKHQGYIDEKSLLAESGLK